LLMNLSYDPTLGNVYNYVLSATNQDIVVSQIDDPNYDNPV